MLHKSDCSFRKLIKGTSIQFLCINLFISQKSGITVEVTATQPDSFGRDDDLEVEHQEYKNANSKDQTVTIDKQIIRTKMITKFEKIFGKGSAGAKGTA